MSVGWIIDAAAFPSYHEELAAAIIRNGHRAVSLNRPSPPYDWDDVGNNYQNAFPKGDCVVVHGDIDLVSRIHNDRLWTPGPFATVERFHCSRYFAHYGKFLLNHDYIMLPYAELPRCRDFLFSTLGANGRLFVRPDSPLKLFTGMTIDTRTFERDYEFMGFYEFPVESLVVVSSPKQVVAEWRYVIADRAIVAGSQYLDGGAKIAVAANDSGAYELAQTILQVPYVPDSVWVLDICRTADNTYHLLEIGSFSFCDLYACDKDAVVCAVSTIAEHLHASQQTS